MIGRLVILLIVANLAWAAWSQGWLQSVGMAPRPQTEPERLQRQLHPESLRIGPVPSAAADRPDEPPPAPPQAAASAEPATPAQPAAPIAHAVPIAHAASAAFVAPAASAAEAPEAPQAQASSAAAAAAGLCMQAGPFDDKQIEAVRRAAAALPAGSWRVEQVALPGRWMVYIGKLADAAAVRAKRAELRGLGVSTDRPGAAWEPGLSLGRFSNEESAQRALADMGRKGVHTARVVQERRDTPAYLLRLPASDAALRQQAQGLRGAMGDKELRACESGATASSQ